MSKTTCTPEIGRPVSQYAGSRVAPDFLAQSLRHRRRTMDARVSNWLDLGAKQRQDSEEGIPLGGISVNREKEE